MPCRAGTWPPSWVAPSICWSNRLCGAALARPRAPSKQPLRRRPRESLPQNQRRRRWSAPLQTVHRRVRAQHPARQRRHRQHGPPAPIRSARPARPPGRRHHPRCPSRRPTRAATYRAPCVAQYSIAMVCAARGGAPMARSAKAAPGSNAITSRRAAKAAAIMLPTFATCAAPTIGLRPNRLTENPRSLASSPGAAPAAPKRRPRSSVLENAAPNYRFPIFDATPTKPAGTCGYAGARCGGRPSAPLPRRRAERCAARRVRDARPRCRLQSDRRRRRKVCRWRCLDRASRMVVGHAGAALDARTTRHPHLHAVSPGRHRRLVEGRASAQGEDVEMALPWGAQVQSASCMRGCRARRPEESPSPIDVRSPGGCKTSTGGCASDVRLGAYGTRGALCRLPRQRRRRSCVDRTASSGQGGRRACAGAALDARKSRHLPSTCVTRSGARRALCEVRRAMCGSCVRGREGARCRLPETGAVPTKVWRWRCLRVGKSGGRPHAPVPRRRPEGSASNRPHTVSQVGCTTSTGRGHRARCGSASTSGRRHACAGAAFDARGLSIPICIAVSQVVGCKTTRRQRKRCAVRRVRDPRARCGLRKRRAGPTQPLPASGKSRGRRARAAPRSTPGRVAISRRHEVSQVVGCKTSTRRVRRARCGSARTGREGTSQTSEAAAATQTV
jgi:hypothetical protein